jgi:hypothetical protein
MHAAGAGDVNLARLCALERGLGNVVASGVLFINIAGSEMTRTFVETGPKCLKPKLTRLVETHEWRRCSQCCDVPAYGVSSNSPSISVQTIFAVAGSP